MKNMMMIGSAHLDPVWLWQWQEGYQEVKATFRSALDRMNEFPGFVFTSAAACYYQWVEENDPPMFEEIRARVAEGRWAIVGGMWVQPDMNTPGGESVARHLMMSQRYFREKFGFTATTGYNVDSFGHNAMMPQLYKKAGIENYVWMRPSIQENPDIPEGSMWWESRDGSRVMAYRIPISYTCKDNIPERVEKLFEMSQRIGQPLMCFYGVGNHGGGPTIKNLREIEEMKLSHERKEDVEYASPDDFFRGMRASGIDLPVWKNELQHHASGCYSTCSLSKIRHRRAENALLRMEKFGVMAAVLTGHKGKPVFVDQAWKNVLFNEFHDIMGGCSLPEAMEDAVIQLDEAISIAAREENAALQRISWQVDTSKGLPPVRSKDHFALWRNAGMGTPVVVFNPHAFTATGTVLIRRGIRKVLDDAGNPVPAQPVRATRTNHKDDRWDGIFRAEVPPMGYRLFWVHLDGECDCDTGVSAGKTHLENRLARAEFDPCTGALTALIRKDTGVNVLSGPSRAAFMDIEHCDTWAHNVFRFDKPAGEFDKAEISVLENGPARAVLRVASRFGASELVQNYTLNADSEQLEVSVSLRLREKHRMLKLCFPTAFPAGKEISEIPYGVIERTACGNEEHCQRWFAMQGEKAGLAILNDGKYSYSAEKGELRLTIANTSIYADHYGQETRDETCQFMDWDEQRFTYALYPYEGSWEKADMEKRAVLLNQPLAWVVETYHTGPLGPEYSGLSVDKAGVSFAALKRAEDGTGHILRLWENIGEKKSARIEAPVLGRGIDVELAPWEVCTLYVPDDPNAPVRKVLLTEYEME
ncbi:MAG: alpha-mannosidase [Clostridia bacterium]|nr:alpha-mannosidase [Clostridia bacterium]